MVGVSGEGGRRGKRRIAVRGGLSDKSSNGAIEKTPEPAISFLEPEKTQPLHFPDRSNLHPIRVPQLGTRRSEMGTVLVFQA
jgi:hypothetical protein